MDRFKRRMMDSIPNEYNLLFPETYDLFLQFEISNYKKLLQSARQTFTNDMQMLGVNMPKLMLLDKYKRNYEFSTAIYNLSLFYDMSRMVYNETPIEQILSFSYGHFVDRYADLSDVANKAIAENKQFYTPSYGYRTQSASNTLRGRVVDYSDNLQSTYLALSTAKYQLDSILVSLRGPLAGTSLYQEINELKKELDATDQFFGSFTYNIVGLSEDQAFDYYKNYAGNYLRGEGYFNDLLKPENNFNLQQYEENFSDHLSRSDYRAKGLDISRLLNKEDFNHSLAEAKRMIARIEPDARLIQKKMILRIRNQINNRIEQVTKERKLVIKGIEGELAFWKREAGLDTTTFELAGLAYLRNLLTDDGNEEFSQKWAELRFIQSLLQDSTTDMSLELILLTIEVTKAQLQDWLDETTDLIDRVRAEALSQISYLQENSRLTRYDPNPDLTIFFDELRNSATAIDESVFAAFDAIVEKLSLSKDLLEDLTKQKKELKQELKNIDQLYAAKNLIQSRNNAVNLAGIAELTVHLLHSLSRETKDTTIQLQDTTKVDYTIIEKPTAEREVSRSLSGISLAPISKTIIRKEDPVWLSKASFDSIITNEAANAIFLGLLHQQLYAIDGSPAFTKEGMVTLTTKMINLVATIKENQKAIDRKKILDEKITFSDHFPTIKATVGLLGVVINTPFSPDSKLGDKASLRDALKIATDG